jgi:hypothetical protein
VSIIVDPKNKTKKFYQRHKKQKTKFASRSGGFKLLWPLGEGKNEFSQLTTAQTKPPKKPKKNRNFVLSTPVSVLTRTGHLQPLFEATHGF